LNQFVPEGVKHEGYIRMKMLKRRAVIQDSVPPAYNYRFEFEREELQQKWIASEPTSARGRRSRKR
jgi:hypothetical protein